MTMHVDDDLSPDGEAELETEAETEPVELERVDATDNLVINDAETEAEPEAEAEAEAEAEPEVETEVEATAETVEEGLPTAELDHELVEESTLGVSSAAEAAEDTWSLSKLRSVAAPALATVALLGAFGYGVGLVRGGDAVVRREFVYTLDESVPDSFLREDRRLLTQIVTIESDSVLNPVADEFDVSIDDLRNKIDVETVDLSEVLRLEVTDPSRTRALAISEAVIEQYLFVSSNPLPSERSSALRSQREDLVDELATADAALVVLQQARREDAQLETQEESLQRQITLASEHINRLQGLIEDSLLSTAAATPRETLEAEKATSELDLADLETQLATVRTQRAEMAEQSAEESALAREINRLEADLATVEDELARRELGPLVASPVRALSEPSVLTVTAHQAGLRGLAGGMLLGIPLAALVAYRVRKRQLWLD